MFSESEFEYLLDDYTVIHNKKMKKHKVLSVLLLFLVLGIVTLLYILGIPKYEPANILIPIYGSLAIVTLLIYTLFSYGLGGTKAFYEVVIPKVIEKINFDLDLDLKYSNESKIEFLHNKKSGIFSRHCKSRVRMHIEGNTIEDNRFELFELSLTTGSGNNQQTHLNGVYIVLNNNTKIIQQIRTNGKPHLKDISYKKIESDYEYKVFVEEELDERKVNENYKDIFSRVMNDSIKQKGYLSVIENETHFALHPFKLYKYRRLTLENLNIVYDKIKWLVDFVDKLSIEEF